MTALLVRTILYTVVLPITIFCSHLNFFLSIPDCCPGVKPFEKESTLKRKNLLLEEQILSFMSLLPLRKGKYENYRVASPESV